MDKSVKWFENPQDASHLALEMDGNRAVKLEQVCRDISKSLICILQCHKDCISTLGFGQALCPVAGNQGATDKSKGGIGYCDSSTAFFLE